MKAIEDEALFSTRFDGWSSWRRTLLGYVLPNLAEDVSRLRSSFSSWRPDLLITSSFAVAGRAAALLEGIPDVVVSIYPQHNEITPAGARAFARSGIRTARAVVGSSPDIRRLVWGSPCDILLHDQVLLGQSRVAPSGFPEWAIPVTDSADLGRVQAFVGETPTVLVTMGSFIGQTSRLAWSDAAAAVAKLGIRAVFAGARAAHGQQLMEGRSDILSTGLLPLSSVLGSIDCVVHHGGLGTTLAVLRTGTPSVVMPQAFDQSFNARLLEHAGAGLDGREWGIAETVARVLADDRIRVRARAVAHQLTSSSAATARACDAVLARTGSS